MSTFDRIMKILDEITEVKSASVSPKATAKTEVGNYSEGAKARENDSMIKDYYPNNVPLPSTTHAPTKVDVATPSQMATFTGQDPANENTPVIKDMTTTLEKYKSKKTASVIDDTELLQDFAIVANDLLYTIVNQSEPQYTQNNTQKTASEYEQPQQTVGTQDEVYNTDEFGAGVLYGIMKQAEYHADLTANYLYQLAKQAAEENTESKEDEEGEKPEDSDLEGSDTGEEPKPTRESDVEPEDTEDVAKGSEDTESGISEDEARKALESMLSQTSEGMAAPEGGDVSEDDVLQSLGMSLMELGITPEQFAEMGGPKAAKLASAFDSYRKKGKFKIEPANNWKKRASRDYIKEYVVELINKNNR